MTYIEPIDKQDVDILEAEATIVVPVSAESNLRYGLPSRLTKLGDGYINFRNRFAIALPSTADREPLVESMKAVFPSDDTPVIIWIIKSDKTVGCSDIEERTAALLNQAVGNKRMSLALSRSAFRGVRMSNDDFDTVVYVLASGGVTVFIHQ